MKPGPTSSGSRVPVDSPDHRRLEGPALYLHVRDAGRPLVFSVKESADPAAARASFDHQQAEVRGTLIEGMANLGFPAFQTATSAVFVKDSFVLTVDATALPAVLGPDRASSGAFAYQVATAVLACWSE